MEAGIINMNKTPIKQSARDGASSNRLIARYVIEDPVLGWRQLPMSKAHSIYRGDHSMPALAGKTIRVVYTHIVREHRKNQELLQIEPSEWAFDSEGRIDRDALIRGIVRKMDAVHGVASTDGSSVTELLPADVHAICACLGLEVPDDGKK